MVFRMNYTKLTNNLIDLVKEEQAKLGYRKEAIRYAILHGQPGDVIVLAGKGHEDYQEIEGRKYHMDERELIQEILKEEKLQ